MIKKALLIMITAFLGGVLYSCNGCNYEPWYFSITDFTARAGINSDSNGANFRFQAQEITEALAYDQLFIQIRVSGFNKYSSVASVNSDGFWSSAIACDEPGPIARNRIKSISITSDKDLNLGDFNYPAGSEIKGAFRYYFFDIDKPDASFMDQNSSFYFKLRAQPAAPVDQSLNIRIITTDDQEMELTIDRIRVLSE